MRRESVLEGVPPLRFWGEGAVGWYCLAGAVTRYLEYTGDPSSYEEMMGVSGAAWRLIWDPGRWSPDNLIMAWYGERVAEERIAYALGYEYAFLNRLPDSPRSDDNSEEAINVRIAAEIDHAQRLRRYPHVAISQFVAVGALVVERIADTDIRAHVLEHVVPQRQHVAGHEDRVQLAGLAGALRLAAKIVGAAYGRVAARGMAGRTDPGAVDVVEIARAGRVVDQGEHAVALGGRRYAAQRGARPTLRIRVDQDRDHVTPRELDGNIGQRLLAALETGHDKDQWRRTFARRRQRTVQIGHDPLAVMRRHLDRLHPNIAKRCLHERRAPARRHEQCEQYPEQPVTSSIHVMFRHAILLLLIVPALASAGDYCEDGVFIIDARFDGGRLDDCVFAPGNSVVLTFRSEDFSVEDTFAWFAFRVSARDSRDVEIKLQFPDSYARFWPKLSKDRLHWEPADESAAERSEIGKSMTLRLPVDETGTWVSAQELLTQSFYDNWLGQLEAHYEIETTVVGESHQGRPLYLASTADKPEAIVLIGRQHPAEVPGAIAMREFIDTALGTSDLAREFRARYQLLIFPLINPDGVAAGHARHNAGLADLNRDWGPFTQPETQAVAKLLESLDEQGTRPRLMLDFHATKMTDTMIFYTQVPEDNTDPERFATRWLDRVADRIEDFAFTHDPREPSGLDNTKNYFFSRYGIPAITYEIADEIDRELIFEYTPVFAEEMMRELLDNRPTQ